MTRSEQYVLDAIAELEAEDRDDISELVYRQITEGVERGEHLPEFVVREDRRFTGQSFTAGGETYTFGVGISVGFPQRPGETSFPRRPVDGWTITVGE